MNCLIFDLDGTLVESLPGIAASLNAALAAHGLPTHPVPVIRRFIGDGMRVLVQRAAPSADPALVDEVERTLRGHYEHSWPQGTSAFPGMSALLAKAASRHRLLAVLSNKPHPFTEVIVHTLFPDISFAAVVGQQPGIPHKPDPAGALRIAGQLQVAPRDCLLIGDSTIDLETASRAGMQGAGVAWGYHDREQLLATGADPLFSSIAELSAWLDR